MFTVSRRLQRAERRDAHLGRRSLLELREQHRRGGLDAEPARGLGQRDFERRARRASLEAPRPGSAAASGAPPAPRRHHASRADRRSSRRPGSSATATGTRRAPRPLRRASASGLAASPANAARRVTASPVPTRRFALIARRSSAALENRFSSSTRARATAAPPRSPPSSLIARAASVDDLLVAVGEEARHARRGCSRRRATTAAMRTPFDACVDSAASAAASPMRDERERARVSQQRVLVVVGREHLDDAAPAGLCASRPERLGGEEAGTRRGILQQRRHERVRGRRVPDVAEHLRRLRANLGVADRRGTRRVRRRASASASRELRDAPERRARVRADGRAALARGGERLHVAAAHELELRLLPDPHVGVAAAARRHRRRASPSNFAAISVLHLLADRARGRRRRVQLPDPAAVLRVPAGDPVGEVQRAVRTELHADDSTPSESTLSLLSVKPAPSGFSVNP